MITVDKKITELKPALYNPRKITSKQLQDLKNSIDQFGFVEPVIINKNKDRKNIVISGHQRIKVAKDIGLKTVPCVELNLDIEKEKELNIRMNKAGGEFDFDMLDEYFEQDSLMDFGFDFDINIKKNNKKVEGTEEFTEEFLEAHNYVILYFDNEIDWESAKEKLQIKSVHSLSSKPGTSYELKGIGRVLKGSEIIERLKD